MQAFCSKCGNALPESARFCSICGTVVAGGVYSTPPQGFVPRPRLVRPFFGRQLAGVCTGIAQTYGWDVGVVRVIAVVGGIFLAPFVEVAYIACWIAVPEETIPIQPIPPQM